MVVVNTIQIRLQGKRHRILEARKKIRKPSDTTPFPSAIYQNNTLLTNKEEIKNAIKTYYREVSEGKDKEAEEFRKAFPHQKTQQPDTLETNKQQQLTPITLDKLRHAIQKLKSNKKGGPDGLTAECFKNLPENMIQNLLLLFEAASRLKITPKIWQNNFVKLIFKKGETTDISNYRPIALLNTIFKLWETILFHKLQEELNLPEIIESAQFGSQKGKGSIDAILSINLIKEANSHLPLYTATIDLSKAYNRVNRDKLWKKLKELGVSSGLLQAIQSTYQFHSEIYKIGDDTTSPNYLKKGLRQGSVLSPILFVIYVNDLLNSIQNSQEGIFAAEVQIHKSLTGLMFVDDLHILSNSIEGIRNILQILIKHVQKEDIIINLKKSAIYLDKKQQKQEGLVAQIKSCNTLKHLRIKNKGSYLGAETRPTKMATYQQIRARSAKAHAAHSEMTIRGFNQHNLGRTTITKILNSIIAPILTYGLEAFPLKKTDYELIDKTM